MPDNCRQDPHRTRESLSMSA